MPVCASSGSTSARIDRLGTDGANVLPRSGQPSPLTRFVLALAVMDLEMSVAQEIADVGMERPERPHVVILGAGASRAAFPDGDQAGRKLPLMNDLVEIAALAPLLEGAGVSFEGRDFEEVYSEIASAARHAELAATIEKRVRLYFSGMLLPPGPTLYDHLVLSLRPKDVIATFNWDPFLFDACSRNHGRATPPCVLFLHGNVRVGYCPDHRRAGYVGSICPDCGKGLMPTKLLFPVRRKNYTKDPFISSQWRVLRRVLKDAYVLTVFGYSAPKSDIEAVALMKAAWGPASGRSFEQVEIVDKKAENELTKTLAEFIHTHHYQTSSDFYESWIGAHPRRTCDAMWNQLMKCRFLSRGDIPRHLDFDGLDQWLTPFLEAEKKASGTTQTRIETGSSTDRAG